MENNKKNSFFYLRIVFCLSIITIWTLSLLKLPHEKKIKESERQTNKENIKIVSEKKGSDAPPTAHFKITLPRLANLTLISQEEKIQTKEMENQSVKKEDEKSKQLVNNPLIPKTKLREKKNVNKKQFKPIYKKFTDASSNPDQIASQIELVGLINNLNEAGAAIIKNKINNKIEILKKGEEYEGLIISEIKANEVTFVNESLNKTYIKRIGISE